MKICGTWVIVCLMSVVIPIHATGTGDLPVIEIPASDAKRDLFAIILSGDGGWVEIDKEIAGMLADEGISVVGFNSLRYFWKRRTPEEASADLDGIITRYGAEWKKTRVVVIGYSMGADVLPFIANRLPDTTIKRIDLFVFLGLSSAVDFQFHPSDWFGGSPATTARPVLPEIEKMKGRPMLYIYGKEEADNISASIDHKAVKVITFNGGHHFGGNYRMITDTILTELKNR